MRDWPVSPKRGIMYFTLVERVFGIASGKEIEGLCDGLMQKGFSGELAA
jgi:hypothetical protein